MSGSRGYAGGGSGGGGGAVTSVAGRTGAVVLIAADVSGVETTTGAQTKADAAQAAAIAAAASDATTKANAATASAAQRASNLSDLASAATARTNLGLGGAALLAVGTGAGTVAAGNDSRITGAAQKASNLSDLASAATARTNLGLAGAALLAVGTTAGTVAAGNDSRIVAAVPNTRLMSAGTGMTGGGDLSADRTFTVSLATSAPAAVGGSGVVGVATTSARGDHAHPTNALSPAEYGFVAWNTPWWAGSSGTILGVAGTVYVCKLYLPTAQTITNVEFFLGTAGSGLTTGQNFAALFDSSKNLLSATADQTTPWASSGLKTMALSASQACVAGYLYVAFFCNGSTLITPVRGSGNSIINAKQSAANSFWATADTGRTTTMPGSLGTFTAASNSYCVAVS